MSSNEGSESTNRPKGVEWSGITDVGRYRKNNEDAFLALTVDAHEVRYLGKYGEGSLDSNDFVFAVSDGMGGANAGEFASKIAVDRITKLFPKSFQASAMGMEVGFQDILPQLFDEIHEEVTYLGKCYPELSGMGATLSLCWLRPGWMYFAHVGDSRIYYLPKDGGIEQLTHDHTHVGWMFREGKINEREARSHPGRNGLQQAIGGKNQHLNAQVGAVAYEAGDKFVICSDGLVEGLWDSGIERLARKPSPFHKGNPAERLVAEAVQTDGKDNTTAVVVEIL
ncbi:PP2C family protein-serine/threonine phosphatase [Sulfuriroseicoccus oceanibius]|uniref:Serine/threonine-protein phosphatase n=1 Tax=Sulfuriroseicoccus oceanibius TaxID=2707525 RepID=A0A6B3L8W9_9BACT|nr:protein phosphatase 2C domain-containing protein [Sulfuriroseicoccus oceanibius]QQL44170.1 serine/threonine-protein phosphatase [Sulfuriroseicoccus oceanibius]